MGYRKNSRSNWVLENQDIDDGDGDEEVPDDIDDEDEDVAEAEDEVVDAESMEFDIEAGLADDPRLISFPTRVPDPPTSLST
ncbi:hypothetical protein CJ030_MR4G026805 [Morella rubra]|uniref:Uncharacterized protein n=1 Tax=Morella rubra TaxID=262757 RepID=A0A6A1VXC7_9ROSI|nr:hypothetical protein CJ030_MR7G025996 [Morella rubra]KAB1216218.1 hypothetical protein CJ030_MR4G026805 [Morella rubra]